jgi:hypothetical protein
MLEDIRADQQWAHCLTGRSRITMVQLSPETDVRDLRGVNVMEAQAKTRILHDIVRKMGAGGAGITTEGWLDFVEAQNDGFKTGPEIGDKIPDFTLPDQHGAMRSPGNLSGPNGLLLVFSRSAGW